jgi:hypothetical protein
MPLAKFRGKLFAVEVRTTTRRYDGRAHSAPYSVVRCLLELLATNEESVMTGMTHPQSFSKQQATDADPGGWELGVGNWAGTPLSETVREGERVIEIRPSL